MELFGFTIQRRPPPVPTPTATTFVDKETDDGAVTIASGGIYGTYVDLDGSMKTEAELITRYREVAEVPEVDTAIQHIVNEAIVDEPEQPIVSIVLDDIDDSVLSEAVKERVREEFDSVLDLLNFRRDGYQTFMRWYIDGRIYYHAIVDESKPGDGIRELRYIDPRKIRKVRQVQRTPGQQQAGVDLIQTETEFYVYSNRGFSGTSNVATSVTTSMQPWQNVQAVRIAKDSIVYVPSGLMDKTATLVLSYLHKALKTVNMLTALEDSTIIYRVARAPERRIFYIDVGNLPKMKAEQYLTDQMNRFKNKLVYDAATGTIRDDRKFMTMLEDIWLARREGGRGTEITTLPGGANLGEMDEVEYFLKKLLDALHVPYSRRQSDAVFSIGRGSEITRDEVTFAKFVTRLRNRFADVFNQVLEKQLVLKGVMRPDEWDAISRRIRYAFARDNFYSELKDAEVWRGRLEMLAEVDPYLGKYFPRKWIQTTVLRMTDEEIEEMDRMILDDADDPVLAQWNDAQMQMAAASAPPGQDGGDQQSGPPPNK